MGTCTFCQISDGESETTVLYEDAQTIAFLDRNPASTGHTLVAPRTHREDIFRGEEPIATPVFGTVETMARVLERVLDPAGISVFYTSGGIVGRVAHAHVHLVPRYEDDNIHLGITRKELDPEIADTLESRVHEALSDGTA